MKLTEPVIVARRVMPAKRRAAGKRIAANIRRLQRVRRARTAGEALAEARGERLARTLGLPLATLDQGHEQAARTHGVKLFVPE